MSSGKFLFAAAHWRARAGLYIRSPNERSLRKGPQRGADIADNKGDWL